MRDFVYFIVGMWLVLITIAMFAIPSARKDLEGKSIVIHQDTLMITRANAGNVLLLSNGAEITVELAEKHLID